MIVVADAHVSETHNNVDPFFRMLSKISQTDQDVVFLGDIFELWIGLQRYEDANHNRFVEWCRTEKGNRTIGFIEGNHEFYVAQRHKSAFDWCSSKSHFIESQNLLFVHGDLINREDKNYLRFRALSKNPIAKWLVRWMPTGPEQVQKLKAKLKKTNQEFRLGLPKRAIQSFADEMFQKGIYKIMVGHFHEEFKIKNQDGKSLHVIPDWFTNQTVAVLVGEDVSIVPWEKLPEMVSSPVP